MLETIDQLSFTTVRLTAFFNEIELAKATGFFWYGTFNGQPNYWLVTNWHVLTGRNAAYPQSCLNKDGAVPNRLLLQLVLAESEPEYAQGNPGQLFLEEQSIGLYDAEGNALWAQHGRKNHIDIGVINLGAGLRYSRYAIAGANRVPQRQDMAVALGNDVFILGYPLGFAHFLNTPIWKRGSIASEPNLEMPEANGRVVIDATTRAGMSGSPVFMRAKTHYVTEAGKVRAHPNATRFIGIYSSRPNFLPLTGDDGRDDWRAEVGYFYKTSYIADTIVNGIQGPSFGCLP
jgi:hypothetical protein